MIEVKAPGKIMLAGEWAVLEQGNSCIVLPIKKYVTVQVVGVCAAGLCAKNTLQQFIFNSQDINLTGTLLSWDGAVLTSHANLSQVQMLRFRPCFTVIQKTLQFVSEQGVQIKSFELTVASEISNISDGFSKPGLGSSAAVVVAVCMAILKFHDFDIDSVASLSIIFKIACLSHYIAFGNVGSGFDVACSTYQKPIIYSRFDSEWLKAKVESKDFEQKLRDIIFEDWPKLEIKEIKLPENMRVLIGFTGCSASTINMIKKMHKFRQENLMQYKKITELINYVVLELIKAIQSYDKTLFNQHEIINLINQNRDLLAQLSIESGIELETLELKELVDIAQSFGAAAKLSGAGGGDCGVAVCFDNVIAQKIMDGWSCAGIKII